MKTITLQKSVLPEWATLEYDNGITSFNPESLVLHLEPEQHTASIVGNVMRERLSNGSSANLVTLQYYVNNPTEFKDEWKDKCIYGWGTIVRDRDGGLRVPCLLESGSQVELYWIWLGSHWRCSDPALRFASTQTSDTENFSESLPLELKINGFTYKRTD